VARYDEDARISCPGCGKPVDRDSRRCRACGALVTANVPGRREPLRGDLPDPDSPFTIPDQPPRRDSEPHRGNTVLVLGILSLACLMFFWIPIVTALVGIVLGGIAWFMGQGDLRRMKEHSMDPTGRTTTQAGWVCAIIGTCLNLLWLLTCGLLWGSLVYNDMQRAKQTRPPTFAPPPAKMKVKPMKKKGFGAEDAF
jgi:hypothetical protein